MTPHAAEDTGGEVITAEIRLIWSEMRRTGSTLGRLRQVAVSRGRTISVCVPGTEESRPHQRMTHWRQLMR